MRKLTPFVPPPGDFEWMLKLSAAERSAHSRAARAAREAAAKLARAGVTIGTGTDVWQVPTAVHMELEELVAGGLSPAAALRAATSDAARIIGAERDLGTIEPGKLAISFFSTQTRWTTSQYAANLGGYSGRPQS